MPKNNCQLYRLWPIFSRAALLQWRHNGHDSVSNHQPHDCLLNRLFRHRSKKTSKLRVTGICAGNSPGTGEFPAQMASNAENGSIWWRHHVIGTHGLCSLSGRMSYRKISRRLDATRLDVIMTVTFWNLTGISAAHKTRPTLERR